MLKDKNLLEDFDLVEELEDKAAEVLGGGGSEKVLICAGDPDIGWTCTLRDEPYPNCIAGGKTEDGRFLFYCSPYIKPGRWVLTSDGVTEAWIKEPPWPQRGGQTNAKPHRAPPAP